MCKLTEVEETLTPRLPKYEPSRIKPMPHKCPVCGGSGVVPTGFYRTWRSTEYTAADDNYDERCRACVNGIVWG